MPDETVTRERAHDTSSETIARLAAQRTKFRNAVTHLTDRTKTLEAENAQLKLDVIEAAKTGGAAEIAELKATIKANAHRGKFDELAKAAGVRPKALQDLWEKSGYKADGDTPDEAAMATAIAKQKVERDYLFDWTPGENGEEPPEPGMPPEPDQPRPGPARGQGGTARSTGTQFQTTDAQLRDPDWCYASAEKLQQVAKTVSGMRVTDVTSKFTIV